MARIFNFAAGPATLPVEALREAAEKLVDFENSGMSLIEMSHRGKQYDRVHNEAIALARELLGVPEDFHILLLQGGLRFRHLFIQCIHVADHNHTAGLLGRQRLSNHPAA